MLVRPLVLAMAATFSISSFAATSIPTLQQANITLDGQLNEPEWQQARNVDIKFITLPSDQGESPLSTTAKVFDDGEHLYIAFDAKDPNAQQIRAAFRNRDNIWNDDLVGLKIDPYNNKQLAYQFFINPLGSQGDSIENALTGMESSAWDGFWDAAGQINDDGFVVEVVIPYSVMNFPQTAGEKTWALEFIRYRPRDSRERISSVDITHSNKCWVCQMEPFTGFANAKGSNQLVVVPALVAGRSEQRGNKQTPWQTENNTEASLDVKWGVTQDITLNATVNPDFSQVEADAAQLSINNPFTLFFEETRPFFTENAEYFNSNWNLVHTRNIGQSDVGAKITGRIDQHTFGFFSADDDKAVILTPGNLGSGIQVLDQKSQNAAARYSYAYSNDLSVGAVATYRSAGDYENSLVSVDGTYRITGQDTFTWQYANSETEFDPVLQGRNDTLSDDAYRLSYQHSERTWSVSSRYDNRGEAFRADLGFMPESDWNKFVIGGDYTYFFDNPGFFNRYMILGDWDITHNEAGELIEKEIEVYQDLYGPKELMVELGFYQRQRVGQRLDPSNSAIDGNTNLYSEHGKTFFAEIKPIGGLYLNTFVRWGDALDLANRRLSQDMEARVVANYSINQHLEVKFRHTYRAMEYASQPIFSANLADLRVTYQFNNRSYVRLAMIHTNIARHAENYLPELQAGVDERTKSLSTQLLYSYKVNPQTVFFLGYSDAAVNEEQLSDLVKVERNAFMKVSYAWQL